MKDSMTAKPLFLLVTLVFCAGTVTGCSRPKQEYDGIKGFRVGKTKFKSAAARSNACFPVEDGAKRCLARARRLAGQKALVNLYFPSDNADARLEEIWVTVQRCKVGKTMKWMKKTFGKPTSENGASLVWKGTHAFIAAQVPAPDGDCQLHFVDPKSKNRIAKLGGKLDEQANPKKDDAKKDDAKKDDAKKDDAKKDDAKKDDAKKDDAKKDAPKKDAPKKDAPKKTP